MIIIIISLWRNNFCFNTRTAEAGKFTFFDFWIDVSLEVLHMEDSYSMTFPTLAVHTIWWFLFYPPHHVTRPYKIHLEPPRWVNLPSIQNSGITSYRLFALIITKHITSSKKFCMLQKWSITSTGVLSQPHTWGRPLVTAGWQSKSKMAAQWLTSQR